MPTTVRAYAFDVRELGTDLVVGVGLFVPSAHQLWFRAVDATASTAPALSDALWSDLHRWTSDGDAHLPRRPAPMSHALVAAMLSTDSSQLIAHRFAVLPLALDLSAVSTRECVLSGLLSARRSAA